MQSSFIENGDCVDTSFAMNRSTSHVRTYAENTRENPVAIAWKNSLRRKGEVVLNTF